MHTPSKPIRRVALIGCGSIAGNHLSGIQKAGKTVCALCDIEPSHAQKYIEKFQLGDIPVYTDYVQMMEKEQPDCIHICTPHYLHAPMAIAALERGIHVLCEKPLAISHAQLAALEAAVKNSQAYLGVCHQNRYEPTMLRLKKMTEAGVRAGFATVVWKRDEKYYRSGAWRGTVEQEGGGVMINQALHTLDLMQWLCGEPKTVQAHISNDTHRGQIEVEDTATALFKTESGVGFHFFATTSAAADFAPQLHFVLSSGEKITAENHLLCVNGELLPVEAQGETLGKTVWGDGHRMLIADFYRCVEEGVPFPIDFTEGAKVIRLILGMYQSDGEQIEV